MDLSDLELGDLKSLTLLHNLEAGRMVSILIAGRIVSIFIAGRMVSILIHDGQYIDKIVKFTEDAMCLPNKLIRDGKTRKEAKLSPVSREARLSCPRTESCVYEV